MGDWKEISSQKDIDELLSLYDGFHDSCIVSVNYRSGAFVDDKGAMHICRFMMSYCPEHQAE